MARLPTPGGDDGTWGSILNDFLAQAHNSDGSLKSSIVGASNIADATITEAKLSSAVQTKLNSSSAVTSVNTYTGAVTLTKSDVGLANADNTSDANKPVSSATQTALNAKADDTAVVHNTGTETVAGVKTFSSSPVVPSPSAGSDAANKTYVDSVVGGGGPVLWGGISGTLSNQSDLQTALDAKVDETTTVNGQALSSNVTLTKSDVGLANADNTSDANKPVSSATQTALNAKADSSVSVSGGTSLTGGGDLTTNRTLTLVNDSATPGNSKYYGTDGTGTKGYFDVPSGGDPAMGGDLSGTASNAQIAAGAVGTTELANTSVTVGKISASGTADSSTYLRGDGSWTTPAGGGDPTMGGDLSGTASNAQIVANAVGTTEIAASAVTDAKVASGISQAKITNLTTDLADKASTSHTHAGADITSGTVGTARLGSGTANSTTYLRGDGTWAAPPGGSSSHGAPLIVAASNAPTTVKNDADYVCDGTADEVQINTAISQAAYTDNGGIAWGKVQLTGGEFTIASPIILKTGVSLHGVGFLTILKSDNISAPNGVVQIEDLDTHMTSLSHMTIDGGAAGGGTSSAVVYRNSDGNIGDPKGATGNHTDTPGNDPDSSHIISDLFIRNFGNGSGRHGIFMDADARDPKVSRVRVRANSGTGFKMNDSSDGKYSQCIAIGCNIGWEVGGGSNMFTTCKAAYSDVDGWDISSSRAHLVGCHSQDNGRHGYNVSGIDVAMTGCVADSNRRLDTAGYGLNMTADRGVIEGLHVYDRGQSAQQQTQGMNFSGADDLYVTGHIRLPSGTTYVNGTPGGDSYARIVRVGSTVYTVG